jgi:methylenetetrahydrofolate dehydrogenase (NADP+)/methenyltetrahydrofolate cyclohydrolase
MTATILDGKAVAQAILQELKAEVEVLCKDTATVPRLAMISLGEDPSTQLYLRNKKRACMTVGVECTHHRLAEETPHEQLLALITHLNKDPAVHGILVQLPLPPHIQREEIVRSIDPAKDVDGSHPLNIGRLVTNTAPPLSCSPAGIIELLLRHHILLEGKRAVILGRTELVGKPVGVLLLHHHATITFCTDDLENARAEMKQGDILVVDIQKPQFLQGDMIQEGAVIVDAGSNYVKGKIVGDVDFVSVQEKAAAITPVPGGVGPMTVAMLVKNTVTACKRQQSAVEPRSYRY